MNWITTPVTPDQVESGQVKEYLVTIERQGSKGPYRWVQLLSFANNHWLEWDDSYEGEDRDENGGKHWNGWFETKQDRHGDEIIMELDSDWRVIAWMEKPIAYQP